MTPWIWTGTAFFEEFAGARFACDPVPVFVMTGSTSDVDDIWAGLLQRATARREQTSASRTSNGVTSVARSSLGGAPADSRSNGVPFRLYEPLVEAPASFAIAHLGQSIDGCIATACGHSLFVTGEQNLDHLHRLRALSDAVLIGAGTAAADNPRLTVRRVAGPSPVRVVLDRRATLSPALGLFTDDGSPTLVVTTEHAAAHPAVPAERLLRVPEVDGRIEPFAVREALATRGLAVLFLEGGGVTVSGWLQAGALDRLHIAIAPVLIGAGRRGVQLQSAIDMPSALRPPSTLHRMGEDILWDLDLATAGAQASDYGGTSA